MNTKKIILPVLTAASCLALAACGDDEVSVPKSAYISYASWGNVEQSQAMADAFMKIHPDIQVTIDTSIAGDGATFAENLVVAAQSGTCPDVFAVGSVMTNHKAGLLLDISEYYDADEDTNKIFDKVQESALYGDVRLAIPSFLSPIGVFINKDVVNMMNMDMPSYDWDLDDFEELAIEANKQTTSDGIPYHGIELMVGGLDYTTRMTGQDDKTLGFNGWNSVTGKFEFTNPVWIANHERQKALYEAEVIEELEAEELNTYYADPGARPFTNGHVAMSVAGAWDVYNHYMWSPSIPNIDFYPFPSGAEQHAIPANLDFIGVSATTDYPEAAYEFSKFMSYSEAGWEARIAYYDSVSMPVTAFPIADLGTVQETIIDDLEGLGFYGLAENVRLLDNCIPDVNKDLPGYGDYWNSITPEEDLINDSLTSAALAAKWEPLIQAAIDEAYKELGLSK